MERSGGIKMRTNNKTRKAIILARVSTARQEKEGLSLDKIQIPAAKRWAKEHNLEIVKTCAIQETGGSYKQRTKFDKMIELVKENSEITDIIAFRVDRITRNYKDAVAIDDLMEEYGISVHFTDERLILNRNSSSSERGQWDYKVLYAKQQLDRLREDGRNSRQAKLDAGELPGRAPYGYKNQKHFDPAKRVIPVEPEATIVKEIFEKYADGAHSYKTLAAEMNTKYGGLGKKFNKNTIGRILHEPFYAGHIRDKATKKDYSHIYITLVAEEVFVGCGNTITNHKTLRQHFDSSDDATYNGLVFCVCGCSVIPDFKEKTQKNGNVHLYRYYHCTNARGAHPTQHNIPEEKIDNKIYDLLTKITLPSEQISNLSEKLADEYAIRIKFYNEERRNLSNRKAIIKKRQQNTYDDMADRSISKEVYNYNNQRYQKELAEINAEEQRLITVDETIYTTVPYVTELLKNITKLFNAATTEEKKQIASLVTKTIMVKSDNITVTPQKYLLAYLHSPLDK